MSKLISNSHISDKAILIILLDQKYSDLDLGVWHLHVELGLLCDVDGIGEAGLLEVSHGEVPAAQGPHEGVLGVLVGRELVVDVEVADALHQAVGRVPRHLVAVALLSRERAIRCSVYVLWFANAKDLGNETNTSHA